MAWDPPTGETGGGSGVPTTRAINTTVPLTGGGDLGADRTLAISDFIASGVTHAKGAVPDPGAVAGTTKYLREDATFAVPPGTGVTSVSGTSPIGSTGGLTPAISITDMGASGVAHARGAVPDSPALAGTTKFLREDATWAVPPDVDTGITQLTSDVTAGPGSGSQAATIANDAVTFAKMLNATGASVLVGRGSAAGAGDFQEVTLGSGLSMTGTVLAATGGAVPDDIFDVTAGVVRNSGAASAYTDDFVFGSPTTEDDADVAHDNRFFFDKSKGAFRAGRATSTQWDNVSRGAYSAVFGSNCSGIGESVLVAGINCTCNGNYSLVVGRSNTSFGNNNLVSGKDNTCGGRYNLVVGDYQTCQGRRNLVTGRNNQSAAYYTVTGGRSCNTSGTVYTGWYQITAGSSLTNSATGSACFGKSNTTSGKFSLAAGISNTVSGGYSMATGSNNIASGTRSSAFGNLTVAGHAGEVSLGAVLYPSGSGRAQTSFVTWGNTTTDATAGIELFFKDSLRFTLADQDCYAFEIMLVARRSDANDEGAMFRFTGCIDNNGGTTALVGTIVKVIVFRDDVTWDADVTADNTNDSILIAVTGAAEKTINWVASGWLVKVNG